MPGARVTSRRAEERRRGVGRRCIRRARACRSSARAAAEHLLHEVDAQQLRGEVLADEPAVAQHRDAVADLVHLVEEVRDEQDRDAALLELADDAEELGHLVEVEARGRLVEDEHPDVDRDRPRDRDELLHGEGVRAQDRRGVDVEPEVGEHRVRVARIRRQSMHAEAARLAAEAMFSATETFGSRSISW